MRVVIVGDGKVGYELTEQLSKEGHDLVVIDNRRDVIEDLSERLDVMTVLGNGASMHVQRDADVGGSDLLIAATSTDEVNILCCVVARKLGCPTTIARVRDPEYAEQLSWLKDDLGVSMTINPELRAAKEIFKLIEFPSSLKYEPFATGKMEIVEIELRHGNILIGKPLKHFYSAVRVRALVCAVERAGGEIEIPNGDTVLHEGDVIAVTAQTRDLAALIRALDTGRNRVKNVMIVGGSRIAHYLTELLLDNGVRVKIIENDPKRCEELSDLLPKATVIHGDGTARATLIAEQIAEMDAAVTLTNIDEANLFVSMYARHIHVPKVIAKINRIEYNELLSDMDQSNLICPKTLCTGDIIRFVRAMQRSGNDAALAVHPLVNGRVESMGFVVTNETRHRAEALRQIRLKPNLLIAFINRGGRDIIAGGNEHFETGDTVVIIAPAKAAIKELNDIFATETR